MSDFFKSYEEINDRIKTGKAVVLTAEEFKEFSMEQGVAKAGRRVDVVTTGTFSPMCSSGAFINFGHSNPPIKMSKVWLNGVPAYAGLAAVDAYIGAAELSENDGNLYGGAHVIEEIVAGKKVNLRATGYKTDCYPKVQTEAWVDKNTLNECILFNPRNAYQNYAAATNSADRVLNTYMGTLLPKFGNITYCTSGELSPLLNDPKLRTIGIGTKVFLGGAVGYVAWNGTQYNPEVPCTDRGIPIGPARTLSLIGDLKSMNPGFVKAATFYKYGISLFIGIGIPIPVLDEEMAVSLSLRNRDIKTPLIDYGVQDLNRPTLKIVSYDELRTGTVRLNNRNVPSSPLSSMYKSRQISLILKEWIKEGSFLLKEPAGFLPHKGAVKTLREKGYAGTQTNTFVKCNIKKPVPSGRRNKNTAFFREWLHIDSEQCIHCGACTGVCLPGALKIDSTDWRLTFDPVKCTACGLCVRSCPLGIISTDAEKRCAIYE